MVNKGPKELIEFILGLADIKINGKREGDIIVKNSKFYSRVIRGGTLALGESYMDGWWECEHIDVFFDKLISNRELIYQKLKDRKLLLKIFAKNIPLVIHTLGSTLLNLQVKSKSREVIDTHYNLGNDLYKVMLDETMTYTCGYWKGAKTLKQAQDNKHELICKKLKLEKGMKVLDIGCGFGSFAKYAAKKYGVKVIGVTLSEVQAEYARSDCKNLPVEIKVLDYRDIEGKFDRIISIGMFEHVGYKNYEQYMKVINRCLKDDGLSMLHTIGAIESYKNAEAWIDKYIFPNGMIPSISQIGKSMESSMLVIQDLHNFGWSYDLTLMEWHKNFTKGWKKLEQKYDDRFYKMWTYYLLFCAGCFRSRNMQLWQIVISKKCNKNVYHSVR